MKTTAYEEDFVSIADSLRIEGIEEGIEKGENRGVDKGIHLLEMIANGLNSKEIAKETGISEEKIDQYRKYAKCN